MSQENLEAVRRGLHLWNDGAFEEWKAFHAPDVVVVPPEGWPDGAVIVGRDEWAEQSMLMRASWSDQTLELVEDRALGDRVLTLCRFVVRGRGSGIDLEQPMAFVSTLLEGRVVRQEWFTDHAAARKSL